MVADSQDLSTFSLHWKYRPILGRTAYQIASVPINVLVFSIVRNVNNFATSLGLSFEGVLKMYLSLSLSLSFY